VDRVVTIDEICDIVLKKFDDNLVSNFGVTMKNDRSEKTEKM
jgi:hypothetical protein